jgi:hypothetical protein
VEGFEALALKKTASQAAATAKARNAALDRGPPPNSSATASVAGSGMDASRASISFLSGAPRQKPTAGSAATRLRPRYQPLD